MSTTIDLQQYLTETALVLRRKGYEVAQAPDGHLLIRLSGQPICKVRKMGGITYRQGNLCSDELVSAKDQAYEIVKTIAEYMRAMENAPPLKVVGLGDGYRLLAEFNDAVLAGHPTERGVQFITWERDFDRTGVCHGHYMGSDYTAAKQDFAVRAGLIDQHPFFTHQQLAEIYRAVHDMLDSEYPITGERRKLLSEVTDQIERAVPRLDKLVEQSNSKELEVIDSPYQSMQF